MLTLVGLLARCITNIRRSDTHPSPDLNMLPREDENEAPSTKTNRVASHSYTTQIHPLPLSSHSTEAVASPSVHVEADGDAAAHAGGRISCTVYVTLCQPMPVDGST